MKPIEVMRAMDAANDAPLLRMEWILRFLAEQIPHATTKSGKEIADRSSFAKWLYELAQAAEDMPTRRGKRA